MWMENIWAHQLNSLTLASEEKEEFITHYLELKRYHKLTAPAKIWVDQFRKGWVFIFVDCNSKSALQHY